MDKYGSVLDKSAADLTVLDVYEIAAVLGHEFEHIIDRYGCEALTRLMPKVVRILEILEVLVGQNNISTENEELKMEVDRLRSERRERMEKEKSREEEFEQEEDTWKRENQDLLDQVADLQVQNKSLKMRLSIKELQQAEENLHRNEGLRESEHQLMKKLKKMVDQQQEEIKAKDHEITLKNKDIETHHMQQYRLIKTNQDLIHRISVLEAQGIALIQQRTKARQQELEAVRMEMAFLKEEPQDTVLNLSTELSLCSSIRQDSKISPMQMPKSTAGTADMVKKGLVECEYFGPANSSTFLRTKPTKGDDNTHTSEEHNDVTASLQEAVCEDKQAEDERCTSDHNIPQFTIQDLQDVLQEKNELKAQVFLLNEELAYYKSEDELEEPLFPLIPAPLPASQPPSSSQNESGIKKLLFTAIMPMVAAGLINDDPTLQPIRRLISVV